MGLSPLESAVRGVTPGPPATFEKIKVILPSGTPDASKIIVMIPGRMAGEWLPSTRPMARILRRLGYCTGDVGQLVGVLAEAGYTACFRGDLSACYSPREKVITYVPKRRTVKGGSVKMRADTGGDDGRKRQVEKAKSRRGAGREKT